MNKLKKFLSLALALLMCASIVPVGVIGVVADDEISSHVYMIVTNPGEDCTTQMRIGFHSD